MGYTASFNKGTKVRRGHNRRTESIVKKEKHIDLDKPHENWIDIPTEKAYKEIFDDAIKEYNAKQKRADRKIHNYYAQVKNDATKHAVYEATVHIGNRDNHPPEDLQKQIYFEYVQDWEVRNPNMVLIGAYYHGDEPGNPHIQLDFVPVGTQYKRGMKKQNGLNQALKEQGFITKDRNNTATMQWQFSEREYLRNLCREYGLEMDEERVGESRGKKSLDREAYIAKKQRDEAIAEKAKYEKIATEAKERADKAVEASEERIERANKEADKKVKEAEKRANKAEQDVAEKEDLADRMQMKIDEMNKKGKAMVDKYNNLSLKFDDKQAELADIEDNIKDATEHLDKILNVSEQAINEAVEQIPGFDSLAHGIIRTIDNITRAVREDEYER